MDNEINRDARSLYNVSTRAQYDECAKHLLAHKSFLSRILKGTVTELADFDVERIKRECLTESPQISTVPVDRDVTVTSKVESAATEDKTLTEGDIYYDLKLNVRVPGEGDIRLIINLESQKDSTSYPLEKRGLYYASRLISAQKGVIFEKNDYGKIRKVYSIWIRMNVSGDKKNTITMYKLKECDIIGSRKAPKEDYDLINVVMIGLGDYRDAETGSVLRMLDVIFAAEMKPDMKREILSEEYDIPMTEAIREVDTMCNFSEGIFEQGEKSGAKKTAINLLKLRRNSIEEIAQCTELSVEEVKELEKEISALV